MVYSGLSEDHSNMGMVPIQSSWLVPEGVGIHTGGKVLRQSYLSYPQVGIQESYFHRIELEYFGMRKRLLGRIPASVNP
jgi:hypothetical protein